MNIDNVTIEQIGIAIPIIIGVVQGIKKGFGIKSKLINFLITVFACLFYMGYLLYQTNQLVNLFYYFLILLFGTTGIYNFLPKQENQEYEIIDDQEQIENEEEL